MNRKNALNRPFSFFLIIFSCFIISTPSYSATTIKITPEITELPSVGKTLIINVEAENIADVGAFDFSINYDPAVIIIDGESSVSLSSDLINSGKTYNIANLDIDNNAGKMEFAAYSLGSTPGPGGRVSLADITFTVQNHINSYLTLQNVTLMNSLGNQYFDILQNNGQVVITHTMTATTDADGTMEPSGKVKVIHGSDRQFIITPDTGYHISDILVDGFSAGTTSSPYTFRNVTDDHTVSVKFDVNTYDITFESISCGSIAGETTQRVQHGQSSSGVSVTSDQGYEFIGWAGGYTGTENPLVIDNVTEDMNITARYEMKDMTLLDAISVLQILCGITLDNGTDILDVNNDSKIGIEEVIYILQTVSGNRDNITCN
ncbi:cohesin domain-containing protein [Desulfobacterales bacterium HSG16]|nr:cohesin domain-containing protein [Desulfobacterales bacterium HSG16]